MAKTMTDSRMIASVKASERDCAGRQERGCQFKPDLEYGDFF